MRQKFCLLLLLTHFMLIGQSPFRGGIVLGFNAAQMDGDLAAGYHKLGLNAGLRSTIELKGRYELMTEILFSQLGSRTTENESPINRSCTLSYLDVPVLFNVRDWKVNTSDGKTFYKAHLSAGFIYGRLFKSNSNLAFTHANALDKFSKDDWRIVFGVGFYFNRNFGVSARIARSLSLLYDAQKYRTGPANSLQTHHLSLQGVYLF